MALEARIGDNLESETTTLGSNLAMFSLSKATCLRKALNMKGKRGMKSFDEKLPSSVHSTSRDGLSRTLAPCPCDPM